MFEIDKTRKHFVPKLYLRGFCLGGRPEQLYVFDKEDPQAAVAVRSIDNVEVSRDAYSSANDALLQQREDQWSQILTALRGSDVAELNEFIANREASAALRAWLARLVVDSKLRSRGFREQMKETSERTRIAHQEMQEATQAVLLRRFPDSSEQLQATFSVLRKMSGLDNDRRYQALMMDPFLRGEEGERWYRSYEEGSWRFDEAPAGRKFITSDIPSNSLLLGPEPQYRNWMWFVMPLSAELQLMGLCGDARVESGLAPRVGEIGDREMDLANVCVYKNAGRFVYASSEAEILRAIEGSAG